MKKKIAILLAVVFVLALFGTAFAACKKGLSDEQLTSLIDEVRRYHKDDATVTNASFGVIGKISNTEEGIEANVSWTSSSDKITISDEMNSNGFYMVTIPDRTQLTEDLSYTLTATLVDANGNAYQNGDGETYSVSFDRKVEKYNASEPDAVLTFDQTAKASVGNNMITWTENGITVVNDKAESTTTPALYANPARFYKGSTLEVSYGSAFKSLRLTVDLSYSTGFDNMEVEGATITHVADTVLIVLDNAATSFKTASLGSQVRVSKLELFTSYVPTIDNTRYETEEELLAALKALPVGATLTGGQYSLAGTITSIDSAWDSQYNNITVTIKVELAGEELDIQCYSLKCYDGTELAEGVVITVTGYIVNYKTNDGTGKLEFNSGCTYILGDGNAPAPAHITDQTVNDLATNPPAGNCAVIYEVEGIWVPTGNDDDQYGNGNLYDPTTGKFLVIYGMADSEEAFAWDGGSSYTFTNPKKFQEVKENFSAGDKIKLGVAYGKGYSNYYSYFIEKVADVADIHYEVSVTYDSAEGEVTLSPASDFVYGQQVTVTVEPAAGFRLKSIKFNGIDVNLVEDEYKFTVVIGANALVVLFEDNGAPVPDKEVEITSASLNYTSTSYGNADATISNVGIHAEKIMYNSAGYLQLNKTQGSQFWNTTAFSGRIISIEVAWNVEKFNLGSGDVFTLEFGNSLAFGKTDDAYVINRSSTSEATSTYTVPANLNYTFVKISATYGYAVYIDSIKIVYSHVAFTPSLESFNLEFQVDPSAQQSTTLIKTPAGADMQSNYQEGTKVEFKVTAPASFEVLFVKIGETELTATDGVYSFYIAGNTTVTVKLNPIDTRTVQSVTITFASVTGIATSASANAATFTAEGLTFQYVNCYKGASNDYLMLNSKSAEGVYLAVTNNTLGAIKEIEITAASGASGSMKLYVTFADSALTQYDETGTQVGKNNGNATTVKAPVDKDYNFFTISSAKGYNSQITTIKISYYVNAD